MFDILFFIDESQGKREKDISMFDDTYFFSMRKRKDTEISQQINMRPFLRRRERSYLGILMVE